MKRSLIAESYKKKVIKDVLNGGDPREVCKDYNISQATVYRWVREYRVSIMKIEDDSDITVSTTQFSNEIENLKNEIERLKEENENYLKVIEGLMKVIRNR